LRTTAGAFWLILLTAASLCRAQDGDWSLVWSDEFNGHFPGYLLLELRCWNRSNGWGNNELIIIAGQQHHFLTTAASSSNCATRSWYAQYTSSRINPAKKSNPIWKYPGQIQAPYSQAVWPSFWTLGANYNAVGWRPAAK